MQKVPLVVYENGVRRVIGESVVDTTDQSVTVWSDITDYEYQKLVKGPITGISLGNSETAIIHGEPDVESEKA
jgi:hypothetical protein